MDGPAPEAAKSLKEDVRNLLAVSLALGSLQAAWGGIYMFGHDGDGYWAARLHRPGTGILRAETAEELGQLCAGDLEAEAS
jgi:hypothetical protein